MFLRSLARRLLSVLLPLAIVATIYLYLYPIFHGCAFPLPQKETTEGKNGNTSPLLATFRQHVTATSADEPAIFRLLVLADPQLEGDSSLPSPDDELLTRIRNHWATIKESVQERDNVPTVISRAWRTFMTRDVPRTLHAARKRLDLFGNDYYLAHIYRTLHWWAHPSHVTVLGDLIGSQWVTDEEFERRGNRYWNRAFKGGERISNELTVTGEKRYEHESKEEEGKNGDKSGLEELGLDPAWARRIINIAGNHDIGYSGDVSEARMERFERVFGRANWDIRFQHPQESDQDNSTSTVTPTLHVINLNTLTLDSPALSEEIQSDGYNYINDLITHRTHPVEDRTTFTLLLTHLPLHKENGICTDGPYVTYHEFDDDDGPGDVPRFKEGGLREQNHLSDHLSAVGVLQGIFGMSGDEGSAAGGLGRNGLILNGHDHTGCDTVHFVDRSADDSSNTVEEKSTSPNEDKQKREGSTSQSESQSWKWKAKRYTDTTTHIPRDTPSIREVTLRSMMGEYGGNAGLLSIWFDANPAVNEWKYEITMCAAGVQHIWWAVHVIDLVTVIVLLLYVALLVLGSSSKPQSFPPKLERVRMDKKEGLKEKDGHGQTQLNGTRGLQQTELDSKAQ